MIQHRICMTGVALLLSLGCVWTEATQASNRPEPKATIFWYAKDRTSESPEGTTWRHAARVNAAAFSPDGKQLLTGSSDETAVLRDAVTGTVIHRWRHANVVESVAFSPDGRHLLTGSSDNTAVLRDAATGRTVQSWKHDRSVSGVAFSPDGKQVLTGSLDNTAVLRDLATGRTLQTWKHDGPVY